MPIQPGLYQHYKGPQYRVFSVARHSETEEEVVFTKPCMAITAFGYAL